MSLPIVQLARRFRFDDVKWGRNVAIHLAASAVCSLAYMALRAGVGQAQSRWGGTPVSFAEAFNPLLVKTFHFNLLIYWVIVSVSHAFDYYRQMQQRELRAAELEKRLAQARLQTLQMQLNPHFLFNSLHAISALVHKDVDLSHAREIDKGVGMSNTRARLKQLYGDRHHFALSEGLGGGLVVCLELPFRASGNETKSAVGARQDSLSDHN